MPTSTPASESASYQWQVQPAATSLIGELISDFVDHSPFTRALQTRMREETGTRLVDWIDYLAYPRDATLAGRLTEAGFTAPRIGDYWTHEGGLFPSVRIRSRPSNRMYLRVDSVADFLFANCLAGTEIEGTPLANVRRACVSEDGQWQCCVIERHHTRSCDLVQTTAEELQGVLLHGEAFRLRRRAFADPAEGFAHARELIRRAKQDVATDRVCDLFFIAEREYWQSRNRAARVQKARQDKLGLGWGNHDHHTYRSSRAHFARLIAVLEELGFECRERFYAGQEAGWGAQVLEQPNIGVVIFADVDLSPEEVAGDFAHQPLPPREELGTVGLWCRLHGEAFLEAGMHHLECQFDFDAARDQLQASGIETMKPFTDLPHLKQVFTRGEVWPVAEPRIAALLQEGRITAEQAEKFRSSGALGSHLEVLQRDAGYKGFNQTGINEIILKTDPRK